MGRGGLEGMEHRQCCEEVHTLSHAHTYTTFTTTTTLPINLRHNYAPFNAQSREYIVHSQNVDANLETAQTQCTYNLCLHGYNYIAIATTHLRHTIMHFRNL